MSISVVIPVFNESPTLFTVVKTISEAVKNVSQENEIILSENGSTDNSAEICVSLAQTIPSVRVLHHQTADYGFALKRGLAAAKMDWIINFSVDFYDFDFLTTAHAKRQEFDLLLGSKYLPNSSDDRPFLRRAFGRSFSYFFRKISGTPYHDTHGLKFMRRSAIEPLLTECRFGGAVFENELVHLAHLRGLRIQETPLLCREVRPSRSKNPYLLIRGIRDSIELVRNHRSSK